MLTQKLLQKLLLSSPTPNALQIWLKNEHFLLENDDKKESETNEEKQTFFLASFSENIWIYFFQKAKDFGIKW